VLVTAARFFVAAPRHPPPAAARVSPSFQHARLLSLPNTTTTPFSTAATIAKLVKEYLPPDARASADTIDKLLECCAGAASNVVSSCVCVALKLFFGMPHTQHNTTQHNTTQHNTTQHNTTQHNTTQHNTTQHNTDRHPQSQIIQEFVYVVSAAANEVATADKKTTITPEHVLRALEALGFSGHAEGARHAWETLKEESKSEPRGSGLCSFVLFF
jgi:histone H3/H4